MTTSQLLLAFDKTEKALATLKEALAMEPKRIVIDGTIQRYKYTIELFWKLLKIILENERIFAKSPKAVFQQAYAMEILDDEATWLAMLDHRNETSHTYDEDAANEAYEHIKKLYYPALEKTFALLKQQYKKA